jgi:two-component system, cell cycle sensor histidine kinase and response regulator CckA
MTRAVGNKNRSHDIIAAVASQSADWTILVVDDEPGILQIVKRVLRQANYTVIPSRDGDEAWNILERNRPSIDLVLTDIVMPGPIDGIVLANKIRQKYQTLSVLFMTGWLPERDKFATGMARDRRLLRKPFSPRELLEFIDSHLGKDEPEEKVRSRIDLERV